MEQFIHQLGIDWRLLLSQAVNFLILLTVLNFFVYRPLLKTLKDRRIKIEEGVQKTAEADQRLGEVNILAKNKIKAAEQEALGILQKTEVDAKKMEAELMVKVRAKETAELAALNETLDQTKIEAEKKMRAEAVQMIKAALVKTVELDPQMVDESLIARAITQIKS